MTSPVIRPMKWWDLEQVLTIETQVFGPTAWPPESYWGELARSDRYYVVAEHDGIVGYAGLWMLPPDADVQTIAVAPRGQGGGLGRTLLGHLMDVARSAGAAACTSRCVRTTRRRSDSTRAQGSRSCDVGSGTTRTSLTRL